ncbi:hypothetical protein ALC53_13707 [Atta colombica]|uniref:Uncharacterized protein n=1 Tax=Atta colombica TaxID=520822 RepID=A0A195AUI6_9HYME|nr:hypothetical protein ALC53_13707 [Atta colombica]
MEHRAVRLLSRRYDLTGYKYLEIGINTGLPSYMEIALRDHRGHELSLSLETWKGLYEQRWNIYKMLRNEYKNNFISVGLLTVSVCMLNDAMLVHFLENYVKEYLDVSGVNIAFFSSETIIAPSRSESLFFFLELKPRDVERRFFTCEQLIQRQQRKDFLHRIMTGDEKLETLKWDVLSGCSDAVTSFTETENWLQNWIASKDESFFRDGKLPERWEKVVGSDGQL